MFEQTPDLAFPCASPVPVVLGSPPVGPYPASTALLHQAAAGVRSAEQERAAPRRLALAHLAALRAAAAVLAARARPTGPGGGPRDAWALLGAVAPELGEWARFFAGWSPGRGPRRVSCREADDMVRQVEQFLALAEVAVRGAGPVGAGPARAAAGTGSPATGG